PLAGEMNQAPIDPCPAVAGSGQLDPEHQPGAADLADHLVAVAKLAEAIAEKRADASDVLEEVIALDDPERRQAGGHRQAVAAVGRLVDVGTLEGADRALVDLAGRDHRGDRHVAAAE